MNPTQSPFHRQFHVRRLNAALALHRRPPVTEIRERPLHEAVDAVSAIVAACRAARPRRAGEVTPAGMVANLTGTPRRRVRIWVATDVQARAVGLTSLTEAVTRGASDGQPGRMSVGWLMVTPAHRRAGLGLALLGEAVAAAYRRGAEQVHAEVHPRWEEARCFWDRVEALAAGAPVP